MIDQANASHNSSINLSAIKVPELSKQDDPTEESLKLVLQKCK